MICLVFLAGIIFFSSNLFTSSWVFGEFGCKFSLTVDVLCTVVSLNECPTSTNHFESHGKFTISAKEGFNTS